MDASPTARLLTIGEFSAATQLSPKALRLYDEQRLLRPATIDASSGYRYYGSDQIPLGRLIRTLRDMELPLSAVAEVIAADRHAAETLLRGYALDAERSYARQKSALQEALAMLHQARPRAKLQIADRARTAATVVVRPFLARRSVLCDAFRLETASAEAVLAPAGLTAAGEPFCVLVDPLSEEDGRVEAAIPVAPPLTMPRDVTVRHLSAAVCAVVIVDLPDAHSLDVTAVLDALFDRFDRRGERAVEPPSVSFLARESGLRAEISWAYEPAPAPATLR